MKMHSDLRTGVINSAPPLPSLIFWLPWYIEKASTMSFLSSWALWFIDSKFVLILVPVVQEISSHLCWPHISQNSNLLGITKLLIFVQWLYDFFQFNHPSIWSFMWKWSSNNHYVFDLNRPTSVSLDLKQNSWRTIGSGIVLHMKLIHLFWLAVVQGLVASDELPWSARMLS